MAAFGLTANCAMADVVSVLDRVYVEMNAQTQLIRTLEAQLKDGRLCMRDFVRGLAQTEFYRSRFFASVSPHRGIELSFKHLLGRSPLSQQEVAACLALQAQAAEKEAPRSTRTKSGSQPATPTNAHHAAGASPGWQKVAQPFWTQRKARARARLTPASRAQVFERDCPPGYVSMSALEQALTTYGSEKLSLGDAQELLSQVARAPRRATPARAAGSSRSRTRIWCARARWPPRSRSGGRATRRTTRSSRT